MEILLIEDDAETANFISQSLSEDGHHVVIASDGNTGLNLGLTAPWDLLIVDRMLPQRDGLSLVRELRSRSLVTPVLFLTTLGGVDDRVAGLNAGADDYLIKPFAFAELLARVVGIGPQKSAPGRGNDHEHRRPGDRFTDPDSEARRRRDRTLAAGISIARVPHETPRADRDPHDAP